MRGVQPDRCRVLQLRRDQGLTQEQLADRANCDVKTVRSVERGRRVDLRTVQSLAATLGVSTEELLIADEVSDPESAAMLAIVKTQIAAFNARDPDAFAATFTPDAVYCINAHPDLPGAGVQRGRDEIREGARIAFENFVSEPVTSEMIELSVAGDHVYLRLMQPKVRGLKTGLVREVTSLLVFVVRDGLIAELHSHFHSGMLEELVFGPQGRQAQS
ncbi:MAG: SgcJ/EcaC family oxidoreductase [Planctomycetaceae bacterium]